MTALPDPAPDVLPCNTLAVVVRVIVELDRIGVTISVDEQGRLQLDGATHRIDVELFERVKLCRQLLIWHALAARTGHQWIACNACGLARLIVPPPKPRPCVMTPNCPGRYPARLGARRQPRRRS